MKKIIACIIAVILCVSSVAFAETEFSLRSGLEFGMSVEEVVACEAESGVKLGYGLFWPLLDYYDIGPDWANGLSTRYACQVEVAGIYGTSIVYRFDDSGELISVLYDFPDMKRLEKSHRGDTYNDLGDTDMYNSLYNVLMEMYGEPTVFDNYTLNFDAESYRSDYAEYLEKGALANFTPGFSHDSSNCQFEKKDIKEWVVEADGKWVEIQLLHYRLKCETKGSLSWPVGSGKATATEEIEGVDISYSVIPNELVENSVAVAEPTVEPTAEPKDFNAVALSNARLLKSYLKAPDTMVIIGNIYIIEGENEIVEGENDDIYLITYTEQDAYGVPLQETAVFQGNSYVNSLSELEKLYDKLEQEINAKGYSVGLAIQQIQIGTLLIQIQSAPQSGNLITVSGKYVADELGVTFEKAKLHSTDTFLVLKETSS